MRSLLAFTLVACTGHGHPAGVPDAAPIADDAAPPDDALGLDSGVPLSWVDFTASGCATFDAAGPTCGGTAPLALRFSAVAPAPVGTFLWTFGDGTPISTEASPVHTYVLPGTYDVALTVGGPGGTAALERHGYVVVAGAPLGAACAGDLQCAAGLGCVCGTGASCPPPLAAGLCTTKCAKDADCGPGAGCANLGPAGGAADWQHPLCLPACTGDGDCPGARCREVLDEGGGWTSVCLPDGLLADDGASCDDATGAPDPTRCASGSCLAVGARGLCAGDCGAGCPSYAECADFDGGKRCLAACAARPCDTDPWLDCEAPDPSGSLGFSVSGPVDVNGYCAPRRCTAPADCGTDGACTDGFCG